MQISRIQFPNYKTKGQTYNSDKKEKLDKNDLFRKSMEDAYDFKDEEKQRLNSSIAAKMKTGAKLTKRELEYLKRTNPQMYMKIMMLQKKREILEQKLKNCKSKKEVNDVITFEMSLVRKTDPDKELKLKSIQDTEREFKKTMEYKRLPTINKKSDKESDKETDKETDKESKL